MANKDYNEIWLEAMDLLIHNRLQTLTYDKTIKCKIVELKAEKIYQVEEDSSLRFTAQVLNDAVYKPGDAVYVLVPNGDYSAEKIILGKCKVEDVNSPINYVSPLGTMLPQSDKINKDVTAGSIAANGSESLVELTSPIDLTKAEDEQLKYNYEYDTIGLSADFKTLFSSIDMLEGNYGIMLELTLEDGSTHIALLDSSSMFGDPYNYMTWFNQSYKFDISQLGNINLIKVFLYQQGNFKCATKQGEKKAYEPKIIDEKQVKDIWVQNVVISLGEDLIKIPDNTFKLTVYDDKMSYNPGDSKDIFSTWYNKSEDNEFIGFSDGIVDESYDEEAYQNALETEWAGALIPPVENVPPLKETLQLYYNNRNINKILNSLNTKAGGDIFTVIMNMNIFLPKYSYKEDSEIIQQLNDINKQLEDYKKVILQIIGAEDTKGWYQIFTDYLNACNKIYQYLHGDIRDLDEESVILFNTGIPDTVNTASLLNTWNVFNDNIKNWFNTLLGRASGDVLAYTERQQRIYTQCSNDIEKWHTQLNEELNATMDLIPTVHERLSAETADLTSFSEQYKQFTESNANKYCIYWYRRDWESAGDRQSGIGWNRISMDSIIPGMPEINAEGIYEKTSKTKYTIELNGNLISDEIKAILFYNHIQYDSNVLTFKNLQPPSDSETGNPGDRIYIEHGKNSQDSYQKYSSIFTLVNSSDAMINRELKVLYKSIDENILSINALENTNVYWYIPITATMLNYKTDRLVKELGFTQLSVLYNSLEDENDKVFYQKYLRNGYECFFKTIKTEADTNFYYLIQSIYSQSANQNTIQCMIEKGNQQYETSISFVFSTYGTSGTQYTLSIVPVGKQTAIEGDEKSLYIEVSFTGYEGAKIDNIPGIDLTWEIKGDFNPAIVGPLNNEELAAAGIKARDSAVYYRLGRAVDFNKCQYNNLVASVNWEKINEETEADQSLVLKSYYPVAQTSGHYYLDGPTSVMYDSSGTNPAYVHKAYKLFNVNDNTEIIGLTWEILYYNQNGQLQELDSKLLNYLPKIHHQEKKNYNYPEIGYYLRPLSMFVQNIGVYSVVVAKQGNTIIFAQPIYIAQNRWGSSLLNSWDENLMIDEENGIVLSTMVGAGYKDVENSFNGVLMGDIGSTAKFGDISTGVGLYGFHQGAQSFGFNIDGTAFLGKEGHGRIIFDGNSGIISSANDSGMYIDLESGHIDADNFKLTSGNILLDSNASDGNYLYIGDSNNNYMAYNGTTLTVSGDIYANSGIFNGTVYADDGEFNGTVNATDGVFNGTIKANDGDIGGWSINENGISAGDVGIYSQRSSTTTTIGRLNSDNWRFMAGNNFGVTEDGKFAAAAAYISGEISGKILMTDIWDASAKKAVEWASVPVITGISISDIERQYVMNNSYQTDTKTFLVVGADGQQTEEKITYLIDKQINWPDSTFDPGNALKSFTLQLKTRNITVAYPQDETDTDSIIISASDGYGGTINAGGYVPFNPGQFDTTIQFN